MLHHFYLPDVDFSLENSAINRIQAIWGCVYGRLSSILPPDHELQCVLQHTTRTIPGYRTAWHCYSAQRMYIEIAPNTNLDMALEKEIESWMYHEMSHAARWATVGYGKTFYEALISEWLACALQNTLCPEVKTAWTEATDEEIAAILKLLPTNNPTTYNHSDWYFGSNPSIPHWAWYKIGCYIIQSFVQKEGIDIIAIQTKPLEFFWSHIEKLLPKK